MIRIDQIRLNQDNPRFITDEKFAKLVESVKDFPKMMALRPIVVDKTGTIIGGNIRYRALDHLGYTEIPDEWVKVADELTDDERRRFIIEDNLAFGEWDFDILASEYTEEELTEWGVELQLSGHDFGPIGGPVGDGDGGDDQYIGKDAGSVTNTIRIRILGYDIVLTEEESDLVRKSIDQYVRTNGFTAGYFYHVLRG
ncbi:MAG: ParB N-terminal domain-containing protein [Chlorobiaceae bacterium]|nr:ParB N-terminal domain-containing protein [Chlorobiaceae bacterium]